MYIPLAVVLSFDFETLDFECDKSIQANPTRTLLSSAFGELL